MKILEKLKSSYGSCHSGENKCPYTAFVICVAKQLAVVAIALVILLPLPIYFYGPKLLKKALINQPEAIIESIQKYSESQQKKIETEKVGPVYQSIVSDTNTPFIGNKNGSHKIIVFYDYACGYCKKAAAELKLLISKDPEAKVILKDLPIMSEKSGPAAKASMYVYSKHPTKFEEFHIKLIANKDINEKTINSVAKSLGISEDVVANSKNSFDSELRNNYMQASEIGANGTPTMIIDGKVHMGFKTASEMLNLFK